MGGVSKMRRAGGGRRESCFPSLHSGVLFEDLFPSLWMKQETLWRPWRPWVLCHSLGSWDPVSAAVPAQSTTVHALGETLAPAVLSWPGPCWLIHAGHLLWVARRLHRFALYCPLFKAEIYSHDVRSGLVKLIRIEIHHVNESLGMSAKSYVDWVN